MPLGFGLLAFLFIMIMAFWALTFLFAFMPTAVFFFWLDSYKPKLAAKWMGIKLTDEELKEIIEERDNSSYTY